MSDKSRKKSGGCFKYFFWLTIIVILIGAGGSYYLYKNGISLTKNSVMAVIKGFKPKQVINSFTEWRELYVESNDGNILEVATATSAEEFSRETNFEVMGKLLPFSTMSKISVPATYRYHIDLTGDWKMDFDANRLVVTAPPLQPSLPVAYDSAAMKKTNPEGWTKLLASNNMSALEKTITSRLEERAKDPETIRKVELKAKKSISKFLQSWLMSKEQWKEGHFEEILVYFEGELVEPPNPSTMPDLRISDPAEVLP